MSVAITGASGQLGRRVAARLLEQLDPGEIVLLTRTPERLDDLAARGADVRRADFDEPQTLQDALGDVGRLLLISAAEIGHRVAQHRAAIDAARAAGIRHVVYTSMSQPVESNPALLAPDHRLTEQALIASGLDWTLLRNNMYAEMTIASTGHAIAAGQLTTNGGDGRTAYVSRDDCAAVAAVVLASEGHRSQVYDITGPQALSAADLGAIGFELSGQEITVRQLADDAFLAGLIASGLTEDAARLYTSLGASVRAGFLETVTSTVSDLTGRAPRTVRDVLATEAPLAV